MVLKLYGPARTAGSIGTVLMTLAEKQVPFELVPIDMGKYEHKTAEYRALHPFGHVPVIDDDGFVLYESRAICRYIAEKYADRGPVLIPTELKAKALFEQGASIEFANFQPSAYTIVVEGLGKPLKGIPTDKPVYDTAVAKLSEHLDVYEAVLGKQRFLGGDEITLADIFHVSFGAFLARAGCNLMTTKGPNVARWWNEVVSRPSWTRWEKGVKSIAVYDNLLSAAAETPAAAKI
ncbi:glutathione S-transferase [Mycena latifolia]|nr:glutathione S-transferase [Mycena latifolia]